MYTVSFCDYFVTGLDSFSDKAWKMADGEDIQPLVCDNGTGMVKVKFL